MTGERFPTGYEATETERQAAAQNLSLVAADIIWERQPAPFWTDDQGDGRHIKYLALPITREGVHEPYYIPGELQFQESDGRDPTTWYTLIYGGWEVSWSSRSADVMLFEDGGPMRDGLDADKVLATADWLQACTTYDPREQRLEEECLVAYRPTVAAS